MKKILPVLLLIFQFFLYIAPGNTFAQNNTSASVDPDKLAICLTNKNWVMYGRAGCSACALEKKYFGTSFAKVKYFECTENPENIRICDSKGISAFPTWEGVRVDISGGNQSQVKGAVPLDILAKISGCGGVMSPTAVPPSSTPVTKPTNPLTVSNVFPTAINSYPTAVIFSPTTVYPIGTNLTLFAAIKNVDFSFFREYGGIFLAGLLSFFAPCVVPLFPTYLSIISGYTFSEMYGLEFSLLRGRIFKSALFFVLGFAVVFSGLGASVAVVGQFLNKFIPYFLKISGIIMVVLGMIELNIIKLPSWEFDYAWVSQRKKAKLGYISAGLTGMTSALCWIPCIGPILATILLLASDANSAFKGALYLFVYSLGIMFPFLAASIFFPKFFDFYREKRGYLKFFSFISGVIIITFGLVLIFEKYGAFINWYYSVIKWVPVRL